ncbi:rhodanese-like domain-containing protein [Candidatus Poribacteria bacterium]|nr:rhodanese-like domain-containing protein [Candidatus Poribacteria bacterium]
MRIVTVLIAMFVWIGCGGSMKQPGAEVGLQPPLTQDIAASELKRAMESEQPPLVIDIRTPEEYAEGHIPGTVNIPVTEIEKHTNDLPKDRLLVLY